METIINTQRQKFGSNRQSIEQVIGLSTMEYNEFQFEMGIGFLERLFPRNTEYEKYFQLYSQDKSFWKWFRAEFSIWEDDYLRFTEKHKKERTMEAFRLDILRNNVQQRMESCFQHQYLKYFQGTI